MIQGTTLSVDTRRLRLMVKIGDYGIGETPNGR